MISVESVIRLACPILIYNLIFRFGTPHKSTDYLLLLQNKGWLKQDGKLSLLSITKELFQSLVNLCFVVHLPELAGSDYTAKSLLLCSPV